MANPTWFDATYYKAQKLAQLTATDPKSGWTAEKLDASLNAAGFGGSEGLYTHFMQYGAKEHCSPNGTFNAGEYLAAKLKQLQASDGSNWAGKSVADVQNALKAAGMGEWEHYHKFGSKEGVNPSNAFDENAYLTAKLDQLVKTDPTNWTGKTVANVKDFFATAQISALEHYNLYGKAEGLTITPVADDAKVTVPAGFNVFGTGAPTGSNFTIGTDILVGTAGNDTFVATANAPYGTGNTWTGGDSVDGGNGEDTIILYDQGNVFRGAQNVKNVENLKVFQSNFTGDTSEFIGLQNISVTGNGPVALTTGASVTTVSTQGATNLTIIGDGIAKVNMANTAQTTNNTLTINNGTVDHALALTVDRAGNLDVKPTATTLTVTDAKAKSLAITSNLTGSGTGNNLALGDNVALTDVTIDGAANLVMDMNGAATKADKVASIDGSKATGNLNLSNLATSTVTVKTGIGSDSITTGAAGLKGKVTIDTGSGSDTVTLDAASVLSAESTITLGDGNDKLTMDYADLTKNVKIDGGAGDEDALIFSSVANFKSNTEKYALVKGQGFEIVGINGALLSADASKLAVDHFQLNGNSAGADLTTVADGSVIDLNATTGVDMISGKVGIAMESEKTSVDVNLTANGASSGALGNVTISDLEILKGNGLNLNSTVVNDHNTKANAVTADFEMGGAKVNITGNHDLVYKVNGTLSQKITASDFTGDLTFVGAAGDDSIVAGSGTNLITTAGGANKVDLSASKGTADKLSIVEAVATIQYDTIKGFETGANGDKLVLNVSASGSTTDIVDASYLVQSAGDTIALGASGSITSAGVAGAATVIIELDTGKNNFDADNALTSFLTVFGNNIVAAHNNSGAQANGEAYAVVYSNDNAYLLYLKDGASDGINTATSTPDTVKVVGIFEGVDVGDFDISNFAY